jgi:hypothetical protein
MGAGLVARLKLAVRGGHELLRRLDARIGEAAGYGAVHYANFTDFSERSLLLQGRMAACSLPHNRKIRNLADVEFRVFSQWGEDGIVEWLAAHVPIPNRRFVEFGVETFREANCRFLLQNRNWRGLVIDGSEANLAVLRSERLFWMYDLTANTAFVTAENIDQLIADAGFSGPLGILSIDIDGNDYWVWKAIGGVDPAIAICEYNPILGDTHAIVVPYDSNFNRFNAHYSGLYFGASIGALKQLAQEKGYKFIGTNSNGINAFFVKAELADSVLDLMEEIKAFPSRHRDSRDRDGVLSYVGGTKRLSLIEDMPVVEVDTGRVIMLRDIKRPYSDDWLSAMA